MVLEELLAPFKWADEQVLRQTTKVAQWWEGKNRDLYKLTTGVGLSSFPITLGVAVYHEFMKGPSPEGDYDFVSTTIACIFGALCGIDLRHSIDNVGKVRGKGSSSERTLDYWESFCEKVRFPALAGGVTGIYLSKDMDLSSLQGAMGITGGVILLHTAVSMYLKTSDPKILDKKPSWQKAYEGIKEALTPKVPVPIKHRVAELSYQLTPYFS